MYDTSIPVLVHGLKSLSAVIAKAEAHCEAHKIAPEALTGFRLFPDMFPFTRQVQVACDFAKGAAARLAGEAVPSYADDEKSFAELRGRIDKTLAFMASIPAAKYNDAASRQVTIKLGGIDQTMAGDRYFARVVLPNYYFHLTTAYNILRHNGVELGKGDFLGRNLA
jgi:uncharacterized protein